MYDLKTFVDWLQAQIDKHEHACVTGDCAHENQIDCITQLAKDCAESHPIKQPKPMEKQ
jgi:hypothetical protein